MARYLCQLSINRIRVKLKTNGAAKKNTKKIKSKKDKQTDSQKDRQTNRQKQPVRQADSK